MSDLDARTIEAPIVSVTVLEDRARITRRATVALEGDSARLLISDVAPVIADKTTQARVTAGGARVIDAQISRRQIVETAPDETDDPELRQRLVAELREREKTERRMTADIELLDVRARGLAQLASWTLSELSEDVSLGRPLAREVIDRLDELARSERELRARWITGDRDLAEHRAGSERLQSRIASLTNPAARMWAGILVDIAVDRPGEATVEIEYVTPGALWRPAHTAELGDEHLVLKTAACVWQNTGEDWTDIELVLSTERASLGAEPPQLSSDELTVRRRDDAVVVETREHEVHALAARGEQVAVATELPGIDDGGAALAIRAPGPATIPSDGRPYRVPVSEFSSAARLERWAYPELSGAVIARSVQTNDGDQAVLAGPVELIRERGWAGRTSVGYVAPGEEFELSWGPDPDLRVRRTLDESRYQSRMLSSWSTRERQIEIRLSNLGRETRRLQVRERIPVSEIEKVKIELDPREVSDGVTGDEDGLLTWPIELEPGEHRELSLCYRLKKHDDVVGI